MPDEPEITLVAALDRNHAIGRGGAMPWHLPADLKRFKALTLGKPVLMGRKTALAIGRALPGRPNFVLSRGDAAPFDAQVVVHSLDAAIAGAGAAELCVIGGGEVYALALPRATHLFLTEVDTVTSDADTFFPALDRADWTETARVHHAADAKHAFAFNFVDYVRGPAVHAPLLKGESKHKIEVAAGVLAAADGRVLMQRRLPGKHLAGKWEFPGGKFEPGETAEQALVRELHEELGVKVTSAEPLLVVPWEYPAKAVRLHVFRVIAWQGEPRACEGNALRWTAPDEMDVAEMPAADASIVAALRG